MWIKLFGLVIGWRILLTGISFWALWLPYKPTFPYLDSELPSYGSRLLTTWAQFDGVHYLTIIEHGYKGTGLIQAFFPLYPLVVRYLSFGFINPIIVGIIISTISFSIGLYLLFKLIRLDESADIAKKSILLILLAPTSFFFTCLYTEGLFFALVIGSFLAARKGNWWLAGLLGACASATRLVGIFLIPALLFEYWELNKIKKNLTIFSPILPIIGMGGYMAYLQYVFKDPLLFYHTQSQFGSGRETNKIVLLYQVFFRYVKMLLTVSLENPIYAVIVQEFIAGIIGLAGLLVGWFTVRKSYIIFGLSAFILPTLTGTFSSLPRYLLTIFPLYMVMAKLLPQKMYIVLAIISTIMLVINLITFTQGLWVA